MFTVVQPHAGRNRDISGGFSPPTCSRKIDLDWVIEPGHEFDHGATCRPKHGDRWHDKPAQEAEDCWLTARQARQPVDACDYPGMNVVPQQSVLRQPFQVATERIRGAVGERERVLNAEIYAACCNGRVKVRGIARQHHSAECLLRGNAVTDMKG